ncbi:MAG: multiheme c-type cytochrome [Anaerolineales bacterium]
MKRTAMWLALLVLVTSCGQTATQAPTPTEAPTLPPAPTNTPPPTATIAAEPTESEVNGVFREGDPLPVKTSDLFSTSGSCTICHTNMTSDSGEIISLDYTWRGSMKANSARDPYFLASVRSEVNEFPDLAATIEDKCATCHMPMARVMAVAADQPVRIFGEEGFLNPENELHIFGVDGVSCTSCHQIQETGLGSDSSYSGGFIIDTVAEKPERVIFGPYTADAAEANLMQSSSGFVPVKTEHLSRAALCATCHTLYTPFIDSAGNIAGEFPEQMPFFEWYYSDFRRTQTCQDCHMPEVDGGVRISNLSQTLRSPFSKHSFVGGNAYMLGILDEFGDELGVTASTEHFEAAIERTMDQLQNETAQIEVRDSQLLGNRVIADVVVTNLAGHKFPTGFPSRRAWIHVRLEDAGGNQLFESGGFTEDGRIEGNVNDEDPAEYEPHYDGIIQPDQVQIYEAILRDTENSVTTRLLRAAGYLKDNRLIPSGFEKGAPYEDIAVRGIARDDVNFIDGTDQIQYSMAFDTAEGSLTLTVELLYQSVGYRWAENLRGREGEEIDRFTRFYDATPNSPVIIDSVVMEFAR